MRKRNVAAMLFSWLGFVAMDAAAGSLRFENRISFVPAIQPELHCGAKIECGTVSIALLCNCSLDEDAMYAPNPTVATVGKIFYRPSLLSRTGAVPRTDKSVRDAASIKRHVFEWHVDEGIEKIRPMAEEFALLRFSDLRSCQRAADAEAKRLQKLFVERVHETQVIETAGKDPRRGAVSRALVAASH